MPSVFVVLIVTVIVMEVMMEPVTAFSFSESVLSSSGRAKAKHLQQEGSKWRQSLLLSATSTSTSSDSTSAFTRNRRSNKKPFVSSSSTALEREIARLGRMGKADRALALYRQTNQEGTKPTVRMMNHAIDACGRATPRPRVDEAFEIFNQGVQDLHLRPNVFTFGTLMSTLARAGRADRVRPLLTSMEEFQVMPNAVVYSSAIAACARANPPQPRQALQLLKEATHTRALHMNVIGYNAAISACANAGDYKTAIALLEYMDNPNNNKEPVSPLQADNEQVDKDTTTTAANQGISVPSTLLSSLVHHHSTEKPPLPPPRPDAVTFGTVLAACERSDQWEQVLVHVKKMQQRYPLDGLAFTSALHACQQLGLAYEALDYLEQMKKTSKTRQQQQESTTTAIGADGRRRPPLLGPDAVAYRLAISACARGGLWQHGIRLLREEIETRDVVAYTAAITGCEYAGEWKHAFALLQHMRQENINPNHGTIAAVMGACATACAKLQQQKSKLHNNNNNNNATEMLLPQAKAMKLLRVLQNDQTLPSSMFPNVVVYNAAIRVCAEAGDLSRAFQLFDRLCQRREDQNNDDLTPTIVTYGSLMTACERVGSVQGVKRVFQLLRNHASAFPNDEQEQLKPNDILYGAAISACRKAKQSEQAFRLLARMVREGWTPTIATFHTVLLAQAEAARSSQKQSRKKSQGQSNSNGDTNDHVDRAIQVFQLMQEQHQDIHTESSATTTSTAPNRCRPNCQTYQLMVRTLALHQQPALAEQYLHQMRHQGGYPPDVDLFTITITSFERCGKPLEALRLMESMRQDGYDFYESPVLNAAFKRLVQLAHATVGRGGTADARPALPKQNTTSSNVTDG